MNLLLKQIYLNNEIDLIKITNNKIKIIMTQKFT